MPFSLGALLSPTVASFCPFFKIVSGFCSSSLPATPVLAPRAPDRVFAAGEPAAYTSAAGPRLVISKPVIVFKVKTTLARCPGARWNFFGRGLSQARK